MHKLGVDSLQELHALMTRMSAAIVNADWDELMTLDTERRDKLNIAAASTFDRTVHKLILRQLVLIRNKRSKG